MSTVSYPFLDHPGVLAFAHRGGAGDWPENSFPAFESAAALGYRYVETDVHVTADGVLLAFHDDHLDRVTDQVGAIADLPYAQVRPARIDGREPIPLLEDLLGTFPGLRFNIDPKHDGCVDALVSVIERTASIERICCGAFSDTRLATLRKRLGPRLCTSLGPRATAKLRAAAYGLPGGGRLPATCAQVPTEIKGRTLVDARFVSAAHRRHIQVHVWTIDDAQTMDRLLDLGVDGIMTDHPAVLKQVLEARGRWTGNDDV